jgi:hypothetical protein
LFRWGTRIFCNIFNAAGTGSATLGNHHDHVFEKMNVSVSAGAQIKFKSIEIVSGCKRVSLSGHLFVKFSTPQAQGFRYLKATHCC